MAGCKPVDAPSHATGPALANEQGPQFLTPPRGTTARRAPGGSVEVAGRASPGAQVTLRNPDGQAISATAGGDGGWSARVASAAQPRLYALSATADGRTFRGEGALVIAPSPGPAALVLRAGAPAVTLTQGQGALALEAIDFDSGGLAVAGLAAPRASLRVSLDGRPAAAGQADGGGRFALLAVQADLEPGLHRLRLDDGGRALEVAFDATPATAGAPYAVRPLAGGWRIDWSSPGGGVQSSILFAQPMSQAAR